MYKCIQYNNLKVNNLKRGRGARIKITKMELSSVEVLGKGLSPKFLANTLRLNAGVV
ncbi:hypothetical protein I6E45_07540 [Clostridium perfringens]|nr:hypothetical protein [Clostridium perfringens]MDZ4935781.1 hypothetical protein [Clostridium perfringens]MDZ5021164.1 hypothetical protein [Clostridium perfringens]MDZ5046111.1 hypothetical protein [Clostridium perfringens]MDZ5050397.1 hypothetical protein [Clostridium perfringens]